MHEARWLIRADAAIVAELDAVLMGSDAVDVEWIREMTSQRNVVARVAIHNAEIVGWEIHTLAKREYVIHRIGIAPEYQRQGRGSDLVQRLIRNLDPTGRNAISVYIPEDRLEAQLFFRSLGFRYVKTESRCYQLRYTLGSGSEPGGKWSPRNRISTLT